MTQNDEQLINTVIDSEVELGLLTRFHNEQGAGWGSFRIREKELKSLIKYHPAPKESTSANAVKELESIDEMLACLPPPTESARGDAMRRIIERRRQRVKEWLAANGTIDKSRTPRS